ncbi:MAG: DUF4118 domain-containing protein [Planctomycetes bacterium]|nr:DUF4118 domain-containing protein [Planctomycetota bacterium]
MRRDPPAPRETRASGGARPRAAAVAPWAAAAAAMVAATALAWAAEHAGLPGTAPLVYVVAIVLGAARLPQRAALLGAMLAVVANAYVFVPPRFAFPTQPQDFFTATVFLAVALVVSSLTSRLRTVADLADRRARHAEALRAVAQALGDAEHEPDVVRAAAEAVGAAVGGTARVVRVDVASGVVSPESAPADADAGPTDAERAAARDATASRAPVVRADGATTVVAARVARREGTARVLVARTPRAAAHPDEPLPVLESAAALVREALERARLAELARRAEVESRTERTRSALLRSVSHDLRTPLAVVLGAATHLADRGASLPEAQRTALAREIEREADRLNRLVGNLLSMTRLDAGAVRVAKEWQPLEEVVGAVAARADRLLPGRPLVVDVPSDLPLVPLDAVLVEQVLINLLENAATHTPAGSEVVVRARAAGPTAVVVEVLDRGSGLAPDEREAVFEPFRRGRDGEGRKGVGLGLAVCRGIVQAHGGTISAESRPDGGAVFRFTLPIEGAPPAPPMDAPDAPRGPA